MASPLEESQCRCGCITVRGRHCQPGDKVGLPSLTLQQISQNRGPLFQLLQNSIHITDETIVDIHKISEMRYELSCGKCGRKFRIYIGTGAVYAQLACVKLNGRSSLPSSPSRPLRIPRILSPYVEIVKTSEPIFFNSDFNEDFDRPSTPPPSITLDDEQYDFDMMFSNNQDLIVGSFQMGKIYFPASVVPTFQI